MAPLLRRVAVAVSMLLITPAALVATAAPAAAGCVGPPQRSPYAFTGTVVETRYRGSEATVRTDSGALVVVRGYVRRDPLLLSTVGRRFREGGRYEFHPINARSPFRDNACTATHRIRGGSPVTDAADPVADEPEVKVAAPVTSPGDDGDSPWAAAATAVAALASAAVIALLLVLLLRRRRLSH